MFSADCLPRLLIIFDRLTLIERTKAGTFNTGDMDEYVSAAILRLNESIAFRRVEPFHSASSHHGLLCPHKRNRGRTTIVRSATFPQRVTRRYGHPRPNSQSTLRQRLSATDREYSLVDVTKNVRFYRCFR
jgi:hypothetical protein